MVENIFRFKPSISLRSTAVIRQSDWSHGTPNRMFHRNPAPTSRPVVSTRPGLAGALPVKPE